MKSTVILIKSLILMFISFFGTNGNELLNEKDALQLREVTTIPDVNFFVGNVHFHWVLNEELEQALDFSAVLAPRKNNCLVVDVGMNDGFYTNMAGAYGCQVYSFEIQARCIELSKFAIAKNRISHLVNVFCRPVSSHNGKEITIKFPKEHYCDGGFSFSGNHLEQRSHSHAALTVQKSFSTVSLDSFIFSGAMIDILKVDVEGHEAEVLTGTLKLFKEKRIRVAYVELGPVSSYANITYLFDVYKEITSYGYSLTTFNCRPGRGENDVFTYQNFETFAAYAHIAPFSIWRCNDLRIAF